MHERQTRFDRTEEGGEQGSWGRRDVLRAASGVTALAIGVGAASAQEEPTLAVDLADEAVDPGAGTTATLVLSAVPGGLSGYMVEVTVDAEVATIGEVEFPEVFGLSETDDATDESVILRAVDLEDGIVDGDTDVELATVELEGVADGETAVDVVIERIDDDDGGTIETAVEAGTLVVGDPPESGGDSLPGFGLGAAVAAIGGGGAYALRRTRGDAPE